MDPAALCIFNTQMYICKMYGLSDEVSEARPRIFYAQLSENGRIFCCQARYILEILRLPLNLRSSLVGSRWSPEICKAFVTGPEDIPFPV